MCRMCLVIYQQTSANPANTIHVETVFIWKFTSLNGVLKRRLTAKGTSVTNCEVLQLVLDEKYRIAVQRIFCRHYYTLVALVVTALLFAFSFCKKKKKQNKKQENWFHLREIRPQGGFQLRNPNPDFMDFLFTVQLGNPKLFSWTVVFFLLSMRARARPLFLRTVFQILFRISQKQVSQFKFVFGFRVRLQFRNPGFKI